MLRLLIGDAKRRRPPDRNAGDSRSRGFRVPQRELFEAPRIRRDSPDGWNNDELRRWFHPETRRELATIKALIEALSGDELKRLLETVFMSVLMGASSHEGKKPYGYFADNVAPKEHRYRNAYKIFFFRLRRLLARLTKMLPATKSVTAEAPLMTLGDAADSSVWGGRQVDCIVTSPPYPGAVDYAMAFRLASYWFPKLGNISEMRAREIGARGLRRRSGSREIYFDQMHNAFRNMLHSLRPGGLLALVLPRGRSQTPTIDRLIRSILSADHLREVARIERRILKRYFVREGGGIKSEVIFVFRKGPH
jgi:hypothetical protein